MVSVPQLLLPIWLALDSRPSFVPSRDDDPTSLNYARTGVLSSATYLIIPSMASPSREAYRKVGTERSILCFLDLPAEIRIKVYQQLLTLNGVYRCSPNLKWLTTATESEPRGSDAGSPNRWLSDSLQYLTFPYTQRLRGQNLRIETVAYQMAVLRVSKQIYQEAFPIFRDENMWIAFATNSPGLGESFRRNGFCVIPYKTCSVSWPLMTVNLLYSSLPCVERKDAFLIPAMVLRNVVRALWLTTPVRRSNRCVWVAINVNEAYSAICPETAKHLLRSFSLLRGLDYAEVSGVPWRTADLLKSLTTWHDDGKSILCFMKHGLAGTVDALYAEQWELVIQLCEELFCYLCDANKVYGPKFVEDVDIGSTQAPFTAYYRQILVKLAQCASEACLKRQEPQKAYKYSRYGLQFLRAKRSDREQLFKFHIEAVDMLKRMNLSSYISEGTAVCPPHLLRALERLGDEVINLDDFTELPDIDDIRDGRRRISTDWVAIREASEVLTLKKANEEMLEWKRYMRNSEYTGCYTFNDRLDGSPAEPFLRSWGSNWTPLYEDFLEKYRRDHRRTWERRRSHCHNVACAGPESHFGSLT